MAKYHFITIRPHISLLLFQCEQRPTPNKLHKDGRRLARFQSLHPFSGSPAPHVQGTKLDAQVFYSLQDNLQVEDDREVNHHGNAVKVDMWLSQCIDVDKCILYLK